MGNFRAPVALAAALFFGSSAQADVGTDWLNATQSYLDSLSQRIEALEASGDEELADLEAVKALADLYQVAIPTGEDMAAFIDGGAAAFQSLSASLRGTAMPPELLAALKLDGDALRNLLLYAQANSVCQATVIALFDRFGMDALGFVDDGFFGRHCVVVDEADFIAGSAAPIYDRPQLKLAALECAGAGVDYVQNGRTQVADSADVACAVVEALADPYALIPDPGDRIDLPDWECLDVSWDQFQSSASASSSVTPCALIDLVNDPWSVVSDPGGVLPDCVDPALFTSQANSADAQVCDLVRLINDPWSVIGDPTDLIRVCEADQSQTRATAQQIAVCDWLKRPPEYWTDEIMRLAGQVKKLLPGDDLPPPTTCQGDPTGLSCVFEALGIKYVYIDAGSRFYWLPGVPLPILVDDPRGGYTLFVASVEPTSDGVASGGAALRVEQTLYLNIIDASVSSQGVFGDGVTAMTSPLGTGIVRYQSVAGDFYVPNQTASASPVDCAVSLQIEGGIMPDDYTTLYAGASASAFPRSLTLGMNGSIAGTVGASIETVPGCAVHSIDVPVGTVLDNALGTVSDYANYYAAAVFRALGTSMNASTAEDSSGTYGSSHPPAHNKAEMAAGPFSAPPAGDYLTLYAGRDRQYGSDIQINLDLPLDVPRELKAALTGSSVGALEVEVGATPPGYVRASLDVNQREMINGEVFGLTSEVRLRAAAPQAAGLSVAGEISFEAPDPIREVTIGIPLIGSLGFSTGIWRVPETVTVCMAGTGACPNPGSKANDVKNVGSFRIETSEPTYPYVSLVSSLGSVNVGIWLHKLGGYAGLNDDPLSAWAGFDTERTEIGGGLGLAGPEGCANGCGYLDARLLAWFEARELVVSERYPYFSLKGAHGCHSKSGLSLAGREIKAFKKLCGMLQFGEPGDIHGTDSGGASDGGTDLTVVGDIVLLGNPACQRVNTHLEEAPLGYIPAGLIDGLGTTDGEYYYNPAQIVHQPMEPVYRVVCPSAAADSVDEDSPHLEGSDGGSAEGPTDATCVDPGNPAIDSQLSNGASCL